MRDPHFRSVFRVQKWSREVSNFNCEILSSLVVSPSRSPSLVSSPVPSFLTSSLLMGFFWCVQHQTSNQEHQTSNQERQINNLEHQIKTKNLTSNQKHQTSN